MCQGYRRLKWNVYWRAVKTGKLHHKNELIKKINAQPKRSNSGSVGVGAVTFVIVAIVLIIVIPIFYQLLDVFLSLPAQPNQVQTYLTAIGNTGGTGFNILTLLLLIIPVGVILAVLGIHQRRRRGSENEW